MARYAKKIIGPMRYFFLDLLRGGKTAPQSVTKIAAKTRPVNLMVCNCESNGPPPPMAGLCLMKGECSTILNQSARRRILAVVPFCGTEPATERRIEAGASARRSVEPGSGGEDFPIRRRARGEFGAENAAGPNGFASRRSGSALGWWTNRAEFILGSRRHRPPCRVKYSYGSGAPKLYRPPQRPDEGWRRRVAGPVGAETPCRMVRAWGRGPARIFRARGQKSKDHRPKALARKFSRPKGRTMLSYNRQRLIGVQRGVSKKQFRVAGGG